MASRSPWFTGLSFIVKYLLNEKYVAAANDTHTVNTDHKHIQKTLDFIIVCLRARIDSGA